MFFGPRPLKTKDIRSPSPRQVDQFEVLLSITEKKDIAKYTFQDAIKSTDKGRMNHAR